MLANLLEEKIEKYFHRTYIRPYCLIFYLYYNKNRQLQRGEELQLSEQNERLIKIDTVSPKEILGELQNKDVTPEPGKTDINEEQSSCKKKEDDKSSTGGNKSIFELLEEDIMVYSGSREDKASVSIN